MKAERKAYNGILELLEQKGDEESLLNAFVTREVVENYDRITGTNWTAIGSALHMTLGAFVRF